MVKVHVHVDVVVDDDDRWQLFDELQFTFGMQMWNSNEQRPQHSKTHAAHTRTHTHTTVSVCVVVLMLANCRHLCPLGHYVNVFAYFLLPLPSHLQCHYCPCLCKIKSLNSIAWCRCARVCVCVCPKTVPSAAYRFSRKLSYTKMWHVFLSAHTRAFVTSDMPASRM